MEQKQAIADRLKQSNNILVTVSNNPSIDQLSACIGLTLALNKMGKHATAVFSGNVPSTIEFLQPEKTIEKNTDSLRDFIIALDKAKADKLRYKVEDKVVKIFITPYKTSITENDLDFSQGDFNVDVVIALGVHQQSELDQAITAHGRILHDAVVATVNTKPGGELGTINWLETGASSLSELVVQLLNVVDPQVMDGQMATALLTGIVAETDRFSNEKTTPQTMSISAELMGAGANQQLVATKLEEPAPPLTPPASPVHDQGAPLQGEAAAKPEVHNSDDGTLEITHAHDEPQTPAVPPAPADEPEANEDEKKSSEEATPQIRIDEHGALHDLEPDKPTPAEKAKKEEPGAGGSIDPTGHMASSHMILQPPAAMSGQMNASGLPEDESPADPLSLPQPDTMGFGAGPSSFGPPPASASAVPPSMPYLPPSMTPGGTITPANPAPPPPPPPPPEPSAQPIVAAPASEPSTAVTPTPQVVQPAADNTSVPARPTPTSAPPSETLSQIEADVNSPHLQQGAPVPAAIDQPVVPTTAPPAAPPAPEPPAAAASIPEPAASPPIPEPPAATPQSAADSMAPDLASARDAVLQAIASQPGQPVGPEPIQALNAQPLGEPLHTGPAAPPAAPLNLDASANPTFTLPDAEPQSGTNNGTQPPASPPPMVPPFGQ